GAGPKLVAVPWKHDHQNVRAFGRTRARAGSREQRRTAHGGLVPAIPGWKQNGTRLGARRLDRYAASRRFVYAEAERSRRRRQLWGQPAFLGVFFRHNRAELDAVV